MPESERLTLLQLDSQRKPLRLLESKSQRELKQELLTLPEP